jgi:hypothetical protein
VQLAMGVAVDDGTRTDAAAPMDAPPAPPTTEDGIERAGPGPEVSASFKAKVQRALEILDPKLAKWWKANSVEGQIRSRATWYWQYRYFSRMEGNGQPFIYVDQKMTAGETAQAIVAEVATGWFADSIGAFHRKYKFHQTLDSREFREWQKGATGEAAWFAGFMAELYVNGIASLTPAGDLVVTIGDVAERGPQWDQLLSVLPIIGMLPIGAVILKVGKRSIKVPRQLARELGALTDGERKKLLAQAAAANTDEEAAAIIKRGVAATRGPGHHIATNKNWVSTIRGGPWSPRFEKIFKKAGMTLKDAENIVNIPGHAGPHPEAYHREIFDRLTQATAGKQGVEYSEALIGELQRIARDVRREGSQLNRLLTEYSRRQVSRMATGTHVGESWRAWTSRTVREPHLMLVRG